MTQEGKRPLRVWAGRGAVVAGCLVLVVVFGFWARLVWATPQPSRTSDRSFAAAKENVVRLTAWVAGQPVQAATRGTQQGCAVGKIGQGPPWFWKQEFEVPYSAQAVKDIAERMAELRDKGWRYSATSGAFEQTKTRMGMNIINAEQITIDVWRPSQVVIEDDAKAGNPPERHSISITGQSECAD